MFAAYCAGLPNAVAQGGRYDEVGLAFGRSRPATGFSLDLRELTRVAVVADAPAPIVAPWDDSASLRAAIAALRARGETVVQGLAGTDAGTDDAARDAGRARRRMGRASRAAPTNLLTRFEHEQERRRDRHPVGRRRQGQGRRLADRPRARRRALPGRPQRRPHADRRRQEDRAAADPVGDHAARHAVLHRQRRRAVARGAAEGDRRARGGRRRRRGAAVDQRGVPADPARTTSRSTRVARRSAARRRSARPAAASARPTRTRSRDARSACRTCSRRTVSARVSTRSSTSTTSC